MIGLSTGWHLGGLYPLALVGVAAVVIVGVLVMSHQHEKAFSASVAYVLLGVVGALALAALDVAPLDPEGDAGLFERLAELALIVAVFSAGLTIERRVSRQSTVSILTLLVVVMPLTILAIAAFGMWAMGLSFGAAFLLGAILAPTDPVLAGDVGLTGPGGDVLGEPRLSLHTEAGFNDGLASPFVVLGLFIAQQGGSDWLRQWLLADLVYGAGFALLLGAAVGYGVAAGLDLLRSRNLIVGHLEGIAAVATIFALYGITEALGAYGLLAVFAAGFTFRRYQYDHLVHHTAHHASEAAGKSLELLVLLLLGTMITTEGLGVPGVAGWLLAPALILIIRPGLVLLTVRGDHMDRRAKVFLGFFGVRGVAALFYAAVVAESHALEPSEQTVVVWTTIAVVVASIVVHGVSATPLTKRWLEAPRSG